MNKELTDDKIVEIENTRPHVVILGAGATIATIPNGDKNGKCSSVMDGFIQNLGLEPILQGLKFSTQSGDIEKIYTELLECGEECREVRLQLENAIFSYFAKLQLPDEITIYDKLVLALTSKDIIATFNWDPLLIEAYNRASEITNNLPKLTFLHGNVAAGYCEQCGHFGSLQRVLCDHCDAPYHRSPLLYPVRNKDYNSNPFIKQEWIHLKSYLCRAKMITIFGYRAPDTDVEAAQLLKEAFTEYLPAQRFSHIDIIERPNFNYDELSQIWREFARITNDNFCIYGSFYNSYLAKSPRRTVECLCKRNKGWWGRSEIVLEEKDSWTDVQRKLSPLLYEENLVKRCWK